MLFDPYAARAAAPRETFSIDYIVTIGAQHPEVARIRWELSGIEEVRSLTLHFPADRLTQFEGTGRLETIPDGLRWIPGRPYAHLTYLAKIDHVRGQHQRYDSYTANNWIVTRAHDLFPRITIDCEARDNAPVKSRARLIFRLPPGWRSAAPFRAISPDTYRLNQPGKTLDRPRGWYALGALTLAHREIGNTMLQMAQAPGSSLVPADVFHFLEETLPALQHLLHSQPETVLIVNAPDPMWRGGISGEDSFFMHGERPLRTPDKTSPYLHELFHVLQPYRPAADADWVEEGLAEFYSLELQRRAGLIDAAAYARALGYFERFGLWHVDLTQQQDNAATNNSAPLVMYALDQQIQRATAGKRRLDDVVSQLAQEGGQVDTERFRRVVQSVSGKKFKKFFERHVFQGLPPSRGVDNGGVS